MGENAKRSLCGMLISNHQAARQSKPLVCPENAPRHQNSHIMGQGKTFNRMSFKRLFKGHCVCEDIVYLQCPRYLLACKYTVLILSAAKMNEMDTALFDFCYEVKLIMH